jgi:hypothetical protein
MPVSTVDHRPVLVVTRLDDVSADLVITELHNRSVPVVRLDPGDFPTDVTLTARFDSTGVSGRLATRTREADLAAVRSVYWRRPSPYTAPHGVDGQDVRWLTDQARYGLGGTLAALPGAFYVSHPQRIRGAEYKPAQLATAAACGLAVPLTLVTNHPERTRQFTAHHGSVVYKPLWNTPYASEDGSGRHPTPAFRRTRMTDTTDLRRALADQIAAKGSLTDPAWRSAVEETPRERFLPQAIFRRAEAEHGTVYEPVRRDELGDEEWLRMMYADETWVTQVNGQNGSRRWAISPRSSPVTA